MSLDVRHYGVDQIVEVRDEYGEDITESVIEVTVCAGDKCYLITSGCAVIGVFAERETAAEYFSAYSEVDEAAKITEMRFGKTLLSLERVNKLAKLRELEQWENERLDIGTHHVVSMMPYPCKE